MHVPPHKKASTSSIRRVPTLGYSGSRARVRSADMVRIPAISNTRSILVHAVFLVRFPGIGDDAIQVLCLAAATLLTLPLLCTVPTA